MPAGEIRTADVTNLARAHEIIERAERFFDRRERIEAVQLIQVDVVGSQTPQAVVDGVDQVIARRADVIQCRPGAKCALRRNQQAIAPTLDRLSKNLFCATSRIDVGRIEHRHSSIEADVHQSRCTRSFGAAESLEELAAAAERCRAEAEGWNLEA